MRKKQKAITIILLGDIAAGKATHSGFLRKEYNCVELDMGRELRKLKARDPKYAKALKSTLDKGKLAQTEIVRRIIRDFISRTPATKGILFDGTPKMIGEARLVRKWLREAGRGSDQVIVLYLKITKAEIVSRMLGRSTAEQRSDDNLKALENRLKYYKKNISQVCEYFKKHFVFHTISSMGEIAAVEKNIEKSINAFIQTQNRTRNRVDPRKR